MIFLAIDIIMIFLVVDIMMILLVVDIMMIFLAVGDIRDTHVSTAGAPCVNFPFEPHNCAPLGAMDSAAKICLVLKMYIAKCIKIMLNEEE